MAQHDFVPAWLNFSTPQSTKSSSSIVEKHGEHLPRGEGRLGVSRRRHNSSDGFFNNGPLRTSADSWHQPSLLRHDSVDSGVSKSSNGAHSGWHGGSRGQESAAQRGGGSGINGAGNGSHRNRNGSVLSRKNASVQDKQPAETREEKNAERKRLQFEEEDFPSLNSESSKQGQNKQAAAPSGVWENPPSAKQPLKVLVIKKISKDDPSAFSAAFASPVPHLSNGGSKTNTSGPIMYKSLLSKPAVSSAKPGPWKSNSRDSKSGSFSNRDSAFTSPVLATKPAIQAPLFISPKEGTASVTPPLELSISRLTRMIRRVPDKKSEFLKALKDEQDADPTEDRDGDKLEVVRMAQSPSDLNDLEGEHAEDTFHHNGLTTSQEERTERFTYSLEAEHRLLKEMGWQESPENDDDCLPLTEEELREFHVKSQQRIRNGTGQNGFLQQPRRCALLFAWRSPLTPNPSECSATDTSSTDTSDDES